MTDTFMPTHRIYTLSARVLAVATTRIEGSWAAYVDAVPGQNHKREYPEVLERGTKLHEPLARLMFPMFDDLPYAL